MVLTYFFWQPACRNAVRAICGCGAILSDAAAACVLSCSAGALIGAGCLHLHFRHGLPVVRVCRKIRVSLFHHLFYQQPPPVCGCLGPGPFIFRDSDHIPRMNHYGGTLLAFHAGVIAECVLWAMGWGKLQRSCLFCYPAVLALVWQRRDFPDAGKDRRSL